MWPLEAMFACMVLCLLGAAYACDISQGDETAQRLCRVETEMQVLEQAVQELMQRTDITLDEQLPMMPEKRKNEFIRFGKRADTTIPISDLEKRKNEFIRFGKRKNEFIRFGKRKNEFIRFGRSGPSHLEDSSAVEKRKNEFIRFG